jgi:hypothetical protein
MVNKNAFSAAPGPAPRRAAAAREPATATTHGTVAEGEARGEPSSKRDVQ